MRSPAGVFWFGRLPVQILLLAVVLPVDAFPADAIRSVREARAAPLPRYDPSIREKYVAEQSAGVTVPIRAEPGPTPAVAPVSIDDRLILDPIVVHPDKAGLKPPPRLPRTSYFAPLRELPGEPFESGSARDARLVRKHFGSFGQALSRLPYFGGAVVAGARQAEAELKHAQDLNGIADSIELAALAGQDPEITRKTRAEYLKLYYRGPQK